MRQTDAKQRTVFRKKCNPTTNGGVRNGSSVGIIYYTLHTTFGINLHAQLVLINKICASKLSQKLIKRALLVGKKLLGAFMLTDITLWAPTMGTATTMKVRDKAGHIWPQNCLSGRRTDFVERAAAYASNRLFACATYVYYTRISLGQS